MPSPAGNPHSSFGGVSPPPTAEEVMNANPNAAAMQQAPANRLASFGKFWQGMTSSQQEDPSPQDPPAKLTPRPSTVSPPNHTSHCLTTPVFCLYICRAVCVFGCNEYWVHLTVFDGVHYVLDVTEPKLVGSRSCVVLLRSVHRLGTQCARVRC